MLVSIDKPGPMNELKKVTYPLSDIEFNDLMMPIIYTEEVFQAKLVFNICSFYRNTSNKRWGEVNVGSLQA